MKKFYLFAAALSAVVSGYAQWNPSVEGETSLFTGDRSYPNFEMAVSNLGDSWFIMNEIGRDNQDESSEIYYCQGLDAKGMPILGEEPMLLSNYPFQTYTLVNHNIMTDKSGNVLMAVQDCRNQLGSHSASVYKISPSGEMLWGENGILVTGDIYASMMAGFTGCQISDGSYVFAWMNPNAESGKMEINIVRVLADGTLAWTPGSVGLSESKNEFWYPMLVDSGNGQFIMVYAEGGNQTVKAMKYDFDGTPVWSNPTEIYNGGWGSTPMWTKCGVAPSGDNGVLFYWYDDRGYTNYEDPYLAYVKSNGELGFNTQNGIRLDYQEYTRDLGIKCIYEPGTDSFVALFLSSMSEQRYYQLKAQRISKSGDLMWGEEAMVIGETLEGRYAYESVVTGESGHVAFFYETREGNEHATHNFCDYYDVAKGEPVWETPLEFGAEGSAKGNLQVGNSGEFWVASWVTNPMNEEGYSQASIGNISVQRVNYDKTCGDPTAGVVSVQKESKPGLSINGHAVSFDSLTSVYDICGRLVSRGTSMELASGVYMGVSNGKNVKFVVR